MKKLSSKNSFSTTDGIRYTRAQIEKKIYKAKEQKIDSMLLKYSYVFCEICKISSGVYLDCSHNKSVDKCLKDGTTELAWDVNNITIRCRDCHKKHDKS